MKKRIAVLASEDGSLAIKLFKNLHLLENIEIVAFISDNQRKAFHFFSENNIPTIFVDYKKLSRDEADERIAETLKSHQVDFIFLNYRKILGKKVTESFKNKIFGLHLSLLPLHPMLDPEKRSLESSEFFFGATVHAITNDVDQGPVVNQVILAKNPQSSPLVSHLELYEKSFLLFFDAIQKICNSDFEINQQQVVFKNANYGQLPFNPALDFDSNLIE